MTPGSVWRARGRDLPGRSSVHLWARVEPRLAAVGRRLGVSCAARAHRQQLGLGAESVRGARRAVPADVAAGRAGGVPRRDRRKRRAAAANPASAPRPPVRPNRRRGAKRCGYPEIAVDADNEAGIRGVAMFAGRPI